MTKTSNTGRDKAVADDFMAKHGTCAFCGQTVERETLSTYGARCGTCYQAHVTQGRSNPPMPTVEQRRETLERMRTVLVADKHGKGWAYALKAREDAGEPLGMAQRHAWRAALGVREVLSRAEQPDVSAPQHTPEGTW